MDKVLNLLILLTFLMAIKSLSAFQSSNLFNDIPFHTSTLLDESNDLFELEQSSTAINNSYCQEVWCEATPSPYNNYYDDLDMGYGNDGRPSGFWLESPPDDILYIPPPPMPAALQAFLGSMENESIREFIIGEDPIEGFRCNFCKLFADPKVYQEEDSSTLFPSSSSPSKENETFISLFYVLIFSLVFFFLCIICLLIKYKKLRIFSNHSCPVWSSSNVMGHHKSSSSTSTSPSDTCLSPVVNEKSPQSIIMDAPLASLGKKSTISTTGKYWKRIPNNVSGNILFMEDRRGLRSLGGSSTGISDHPYSDAASCTSSPVYAELDPAVAGSCHATPPMIGPPMGTSFGTPPYGGYSSSNTYTEVPEGMNHRNHIGHGHPHHAMSSNLLSDSSTYDNAAYLSASSQPFLSGGGNYNSRSLRRLAAQRSAAINAASANNQISTPLLSNQQYPPYQPVAHPQGINFFPTSGRSLKKSRPHTSAPLSVNYYKYGNTITSRPSMMNHYVTNNHETSMMTNETDLSSVTNNENSNVGNVTMFSSFLDTSATTSSGSGGGSGGGQRKSSASSSQYTEMPLIPASSTFSSGVNAYRGGISETHSAASSTTSGGERGGNGGSGSTNSSSATTSSTSLKRPLPPVPGGVRL